MADDSFIKGTSQDSFSDRLNLVVEQVNELNRAASKAGSAVHELGDEYDYTNAQLKEFIKLQKQANRVSRSGFSTTSSQHTSSNSSSKGNKGNKEEKKQNARIEQLYKKMPSWLSKSLGSLNDKAGKGLDLAKLLNLGEVSKTATTLSKSSKLFAGTSAGVLAGTAAVSAFVAGIAVLTKITLDARDSTESYSRSLTQMGVTLNDLEQASIDSRNSLNDLSNKWDNAMQDLGEAFEPILTTIIDFLDKATDFIGMDDSEPKEDVYGVQAGIVSSAKQSGFSLQTSQALAGNTYREALKISEKYGQQASDIAEKLAEAWLTGSDAAKEYGVVVNDDVLTGFMASQGVDIANTEITDAMEQYYRFLLMSYELQQGNTEELQNQIKEWTQLGFMIDKAKGKLFSFDEVIQLTSADSKIPNMAGGLFEVNGGGDGGDDVLPPPIITPPNGGDPPDGNFDLPNEAVEVEIKFKLSQTLEDILGEFGLENLNLELALEIPNFNVLEELGRIIDSIFGEGTSEKLYNLTVEIFGQEGAELLATTLNAVALAIQAITNPISLVLSVFGLDPLSILADLVEFLSPYFNKAFNMAVEFGVSVSLPEALQVLQTAIEQIAPYAMTGLTIAVALNIPGAATLLSVYEALKNMPQSVTTAVTATTSGQEAVQKLYEYVSSLSGQTFSITLMALVPTAALVYSVGNYIHSIAKAWTASLDVSVTGNELLAQAAAALAQVQAIMLNLQQSGLLGEASTGLGSTIADAAAGAVNAVSGAFSSVSNAVGDTVGGYFDTSTWAINDKSQLSSDMSYYDSAWEADLDRLGTMFTGGTTADGRTQGELWSGVGDYVLDNLNPFNKGSTAQLSAGVSALAGLVNFAIGAVSGVAGGTGTAAAMNGAVDSTVINALPGATGATGALTGAVGTVGALPGATTGASNVINIADYLKLTASTLPQAAGFADGGIGTKEISNATLFEGDKKEAVIPLESTRGIQYLANAMQMAGLNANNQGYGEITINLTLSGINIAEDEARWNQVAEKIGERIDVLRQQRGELSYGTNY